MLTTELKTDFAFIKDEVLVVLVFGSAVKGKLNKRSDINIALVNPITHNVLLKVVARLGAKYDIKIFEDLPLRINMDSIEHHLVVLGDAIELSYYFYRFRKAWHDNECRIRSKQFDSAAELINLRRAWLKSKHERTIP